MSLPLATVVIPTSGRPHYLPVAVESALHGMGDDVEVVVVPNGPDDSWVRSTSRFSTDRRVRVLPVPVAHANAARNHGLSMARGRYVRFLDDDDILYPDGARRQVDMLERSGADVASAPIDLLRDDGGSYDRVQAPAIGDFVAAAMRADRVLQVTAHLFRRQAVQDVRWDESLPFTQDIDWMLRICGHRELAWVRSPAVTGGWRRHTGQRTTVGAGLHEAKRLIAEAILRLVGELDRQGRNTGERRAAAASGLWECVHSAAFMAPRYWSRVAGAAVRLAPGSHPDTEFHRYRIVRMSGIPALYWEMALAPKRMLNYGLRRALLATGLTRKW